MTNRTLVLTALLAVHLAGLIYLRYVFVAQDDLHYAALSNAVLQGRFHFEQHHQSQRFVLFVPTAIVGRMLGRISVDMLAVWPMVTSLVQLVLVYLLAETIAGPTAALFAGVLFNTNLLQFQYATLLFPDAVVACFMTAVLYAVCRGRLASSRASTAWGAAGAVLSVCAYLSRETAVWMGPFLVVVLLTDIWHRRHTAFWMSFCVAAVALAAIDVAAYWLATGDPLAQIHTVNSQSESPLWGELLWNRESRAARLIGGPLPAILLRNDYTITFVIGCPLAIVSLSGRALRPLRLVAGYMLSVLLSFWFGSTSLSTYLPIHVDPRFLLPLHAPLVVIVAVALERFWADAPASEWLRGALYLTGSIFVVLALRNLSPATRLFVLVYGAFAACAFATAVFWRSDRRRLFGRAFVIAGLLLPFGWPLYVAVKRGGYRPAWVEPEKRMARQIDTMALAAAPARVVIVTDSVSVDALPLYLGYDLPGNLTVIPVTQYREHTYESADRVLLFVHDERAEWLHAFEEGKLMAQLRRSGRRIAQDDGVSLFEL